MSTKAGYKGKVKIGSTVIAGMANWAVTGGSVNQLEDSEFGDTHETYEGGQSVGGDITISGKYLMDTDEGQQLLLAAFKDQRHIDDLNLYFDLDEDVYLEPDPDAIGGGSYVTVSKEPDYGLDKGGIGTFSITFKISGMMRPNATATQVAVRTIGDMEVADTTVTLLAELLCIGEESTVDCYFEYGTTTSFGSNTKAEETILTAAALFDNDLTGLDPSTLYYYRAVVEKEDTSLIVGGTKTFTTLS